MTRSSNDHQVDCYKPESLELWWKKKKKKKNILGEEEEIEGKSVLCRQRGKEK